MNIVFFAIVLIAFLTAGYHQLIWVPVEGQVSPMAGLSKAVVASAGNSVELALGLIGVMTLFLGLMKVAEAGGMLRVLARLIRPLMVRLFPEVPPEHPAMGAMILNLSANALGLGNAATPFGIRAMQDLDKLNPHRGTATDPMVLFLAINTSSVTLLPTGVIALRAAAGSNDPAGILPTTLFATLCSTMVAIIAAKTYRHFFRLESPSGNKEVKKGNSLSKRDEKTPRGAKKGYPMWVSQLSILALLLLVPLSIFWGKAISPWIIPLLMVAFLGFGVIRRVRVYEVFVEGAKEGFQVAIKIIPYLVAILVAVGMFRGPAHGAAPAPFRVRCVWGDGIHCKGSRHWSRQLHWIPGIHAAGFNRDHILCSGHLFRGRSSETHPPCPCSRPHSGFGRCSGRRGRLRLPVRINAVG
jgi:spore maturation protein SpmA